MNDDQNIRSADRQYFDSKFQEFRDDFTKQLGDNRVDIAEVKGSNKVVVGGWIAVALIVAGTCGTLIWQLVGISSQISSINGEIAPLKTATTDLKTSVTTLTTSVNEVRNSFGTVSVAADRLKSAHDSLAVTVKRLETLNSLPTELADVKKSVQSLPPQIEASRAAMTTLSAKVAANQKAVDQLGVAVDDIKQIVDTSDVVTVSCRIQLSRDALIDSDEVFRFRYKTTDGVLARALAGRHLLTVEQATIVPHSVEPRTADITIVTRGELLSEGAIQISAWADNEAKFDSLLSNGGLAALIQVTANAQP